MINIFNAETKIAVLVVVGLGCLFIFCSITKHRSERDYRVKLAGVIACLYTLMTVIFNNLLHYYEYKYVYGFEKVSYFTLLKDDITYCIGLGEFRYPGLLLVTFALLLLIPYLNNKLKNHIDNLFEDEEAVAKKIAKQQFLSSTTIIGIGGFGAKLINIFREIQPDVRYVLFYEDDTKNIELGSIDHIKVGKAGVSADNTLELIKSIQGVQQVFIVSDLSSLTGCRLTKTVSKIAYNLGIFCEVLMTMPFSFEGKQTVRRAGMTINEIAQGRVCNSIFIANKDGIVDHCHCEMTSGEAFSRLYDSIYNHIFTGYKMRNRFALDGEDGCEEKTKKLQTDELNDILKT